MAPNNNECAESTGKDGWRQHQSLCWANAAPLLKGIRDSGLTQRTIFGVVVIQSDRWVTRVLHRIQWPEWHWQRTQAQQLATDKNSHKNHKVGLRTVSEPEMPEIQNRRRGGGGVGNQNTME